MGDSCYKDCSYKHTPLYSELTPMLSPYNLRPIDNMRHLSEYRKSVGKMIHKTPQY